MNKYKIKWDKDLLYKLYWEEGKSTGEIGELLNHKMATVSDAMRRLNIPKRNNSEALKIAISKNRSTGCYKKLDEHPKWTGGRIKCSSGYMRIKNDNHKRSDSNGYVAEHILIWEEINQKSLPENWIIHHANGIKSDNRPCNLIAMPKGKHHQNMVNQQLKKRVRELEAECKQYKKALEQKQLVYIIGDN
ncbi:MAG: HNH endonuclease signature motif containing protein [bacterium]|nr:HNH endonuclease signature motif containing protein [bacterium]